jgi:hypothetical protein
MPKHLHDAVVAHHHGLGLHVAMNEAARVRRRQRARDVDQPLQPSPERDRRIAHVGAQRAALD